MAFQLHSSRYTGHMTLYKYVAHHGCYALHTVKDFYGMYRKNLIAF